MTYARAHFEVATLHVQWFNTINVTEGHTHGQTEDENDFGKKFKNKTKHGYNTHVNFKTLFLNMLSVHS